jgi:membrane protease subunit (stomatin/prohibitin family)
MSLVDEVSYNGNDETFAWKYPSDSLKFGTQLTVKTAQRAFFVRDGQVLDEFGPGRYTLKSNNLPLLDELVNLPFGGESPFKAEVWFVNEISKLDNKWGTSTPIQVEDPKYGIVVPIRAFGQFGLRVEDPRLFLETLVGTLKSFSAKKVTKYFKGNIASSTTTLLVDAMSSQGISILEIGAYLDELSDTCREELRSKFSEYGVGLPGFQIMSVNVPEDDESIKRLKEAKDKAALMDTVGKDVFEFEKRIEVLRDAAQNEGEAGGAMGAGMGLGMGMGAGSSMGQQMSDLGDKVNSSDSSGEEKPPPPPDQAEYYIYISGERKGPYRKAKVEEMIGDGIVGEETYLWKSGMYDWRQASRVETFSSKFGRDKPPPPPPDAT